MGASGPSIIEQLVAAATVLAERRVTQQLTRNLSAAQAEALDALLLIKEDTPMSVLAWARQPPGAPGHRALARVVEQLACLRAVNLDPACTEGVHSERLRKLAREGARFTAQHLRALSPLRRRATLVATVLDTITRLTDDGVALFDRAVGRMFRRAEVREQDALLRDARAINDKVRLLVKLGAALIKARDGGDDLQEAVSSAVGWDKLARSVDKAKAGYRRQGIATALLAGAVDWARQNGARVLDACPVDAGAYRPPISLYHGIASTFRRAGFREVTQRRPDRPLMRLGISD